MKRLVLITMVLGLALIGASCGGDDDDASSAANFNDADVTFAQQMIVHHEQAIEMAQLASSRAESTEVKDLAKRIEGAQGPEIDQMKSLLAEWDQPATADGGMGHGDKDSGDGMMSEEEMAQLEEATGPEFDKMFLEMMTKHHQGAIAMSETETADGENAEAKELAQTIIDAQTKEISEMQGLLTQV